jgi:DNA end-binding protein Ku
MRSIWKGSLAFGLVNVPIKVYSATEDHDIRFHQVHRADGGRIKYQRVCEADGKEVAFADIAKAYESDDGRTVVLDDEDFDQLPVNSGHEIEVLSFVPADQIDPVLFDRSYYLEPDGKSPKAYVLLRQVLEKTDRVAVVHFALRQKTRLALLRVRDEVLMVQTLLWPDEVRKADFSALDTKVAVKAPELKMAMNLVESFAGDFSPTDYDDEYREQLQQLIDAKLSGGEAFETPEPASGEDAEVVDLLAALKRSVDRHKAAPQAEQRPAKNQRSKASAGKTDATKADSARADSTKARSAKARSATAGSAKAGAAKTGAARTPRAKSAKKAPARKSATQRKSA